MPEFILQDGFFFHFYFNLCMCTLVLFLAFHVNVFRFLGRFTCDTELFSFYNGKWNSTMVLGEEKNLKWMAIVTCNFRRRKLILSSLWKLHFFLLSEKCSFHFSQTTRNEWLRLSIGVHSTTVGEIIVCSFQKIKFPNARSCLWHFCWIVMRTS